jgi:hypothetical protein
VVFLNVDSDETIVIQLEPIISALEYAINEADGWYDDSRGGEIDTEEMEAARNILKELQELQATSGRTGNQ